MTRLLLLTLCSLAVAGVSRIGASRVPSENRILPLLMIEPVQKANVRPPIEISLEGNKYVIEPVADYEIQGLVVAAHDAKSFWDISHAGWGDFLNTKDLCVVWGENANLNLGKFKFWSGNFTCYFQTSDGMAMKSFNPNQLSNNHLIPANPAVARVIQESAVGDQVFMRGHLVNYSINGQPARKTSLVRDDREGGACETLYVTDMSILARGNGFWVQLSRLSWKVFLLGCILSLGGMIYAILREPEPPPEFQISKKR